MFKWQGFDLSQLEGKTLAVVGDHERYRAHHGLMWGALLLKMNVIAVESEVAPVPQELIDALGSLLTRTLDLDEALRAADILAMGRNPNEYTGDDEAELMRSRWLADSYRYWRINRDRLQQMSPHSIAMHPRPINDEFHPDVEGDPRMWDVEQMAVMSPARMAILASSVGVSIIESENQHRTSHSQRLKPVLV
jgi:aspartate carbamoyltransferase catalytic subunit